MMPMRHHALGRLRTGERNKTEAAFESWLRQRQMAGEVLWFAFEGIKLRLADKTFYTPDFAVMEANGELVLYEVKGFWTDDARVKTKVAASLFPLRLIAVKARTKRDGGGWEFEEF
jgi:predicted nuclease of restriction endonuclease-like RecB superfamily